MNHLREQWRERIAGPGGGVIPDRVKFRGPINIRQPRRVVMDPMARKDYDRLEPHERSAAQRAIRALENGKVQPEPKERELEGTYGLRLDADCRMLFYPHIDGSWHVYYMGDHDYDEATRRMSAPRERVAASVPSTLYHGTNQTLRPGDTVKPAALSGQQVFDASYDYYDPHVIYLTTGDHMAERYALRAVIKLGGEPHVYQVRPIGVAYRDPEFEATGFGSDQWVATMGEVVREVPLPGLMRIRDGRTVRASLQSGLFWRAHPKGRPLSAEDASSTQLNPPHERRRGYSCYREPWDLWVYMYVQRVMFAPQDREVVGFEGQRVGGGNDGEDLATPLRSVVRMSWGSFEHELLTTPFPQRPLKLVRAVLWGGLQPTWPSFAKAIRYQDDYHGDRVLERILDTWDS